MDCAIAFERAKKTFLSSCKPESMVGLQAIVTRLEAHGDIRDVDDLKRLERISTSMNRGGFPRG